MRQAGAQRHAAAIAGAGVRRGAGKPGAAIAAGRQYRGLGAKAVHGAGRQVDGHDAAAGALLHDQVDGEVLDVELRGVP